MSDNPGGFNLGNAHGSIDISTSGIVKARRIVEAEAAGMTRAMDGVNKGVKRTEETFDRVDKTVKKLNVSGQGLSALGGLLNRLNIPGGQGLQAGGQLINAAKGIGELRSQLDPLAAKLTALPGPIGKFIDSAGGMIAVTTGMGGGMSALVAVAIPVVGLLAAFVVGMKLFNDSIADGAAGLQSAIGTQQKYYTALATMTTDEAKARVASLAKQQAAQQLALDESERALRSLEAQTGISRNVGIAAPGALGDPFRQLTAQIDENKKSVLDLGSEMGRFEGGLKSGAFAANDAAKAEEALRKARLVSLQDFFQGVAKSFADSSKARAELIGKTLEFNEETKGIEAQRQLTAKRDNEDFERRRAQDRASFAKQQSGAETSYQRDRAKRIADFNAANTESESKVSQERLKALQDHAEEDVRNAEDHQRRLAQIEREGRESVLEAASRLDARGVFEALRSTRDKRAAENESYATERQRRNQDLSARLQDLAQNTAAERQQRQAAFAQQLAEDDARHKEQQAAEQAEFAERLAREDQQRNIEKQRRAEDFANEDRERRASFDRQTQSLRDRLLRPEEALKAVSYGIQLLAAGRFVQGVNAIFAGFKLPQLPTLPVGYASVPPPLTPGAGVLLNQATVTSFGGGGASVSGGGAGGGASVGGGYVAPKQPSYMPVRHIGGAGRQGGASWSRAGDWLHEGEIVGNRAVGDLARARLGRNFSQADLASVFQGSSRGGLSIPVTVTALPGMSPHDIAQLVAAEVEPAVQRIMDGDR